MGIAIFTEGVVMTDDKDTRIGTQVSFKGAIDNACTLGVNLNTPEGQAWFEETFSYLTESLFSAMNGATAADAIVRYFPGTEQVSGPNTSGAYVQPQQPVVQQQPQYANGGQQTFTAMPTPTTLPLKVKGNQFGPLPDWLFAAAAEKGVTEVYDNRDRAMGTKRPWFKATTGGDDAAPFWPPRD